MSTAEAAGHGVAPARAALAGNPSDGYGGAVLAVALDQFQARALATSAAASSVEPASELVEATLCRFAREFSQEALHTAVSWRTTIPRGVGLGGSSAIVIATTRALCELLGTSLSPDRLAAFALAVETEELGIAAGLQDRIAEAYGGLTFMDFATMRHERLDRNKLPPLVIAWRDDAAEDSGPLHDGLRARFGQGEAAVLEAMGALATCARQAKAALESGNPGELARCANASFEARQRIMQLDPRHVAMISTAREAGAGANYTGSGGAIVAVCPDHEQRDAIARALRRNCHAICM